MSSTTCRARLVRSSNMVKTIPSIASSGLNESRTRSTVSRSSERPSSAKYSVWIGTSTESAADRALTVRSDSDGGQSMRIEVVAAPDRLPARNAGGTRGPAARRARSRPRPGRARRERARDSETRLPDRRADVARRQALVDASAPRAWRSPGPRWRWPGGRGREEDLLVESRQRRREIDRGRRLADAALLIGDRDDAAHAGGIMQVGACSTWNMASSTWNSTRSTVERARSPGDREPGTGATRSRREAVAPELASELRPARSSRPAAPRPAARNAPSPSQLREAADGAHRRDVEGLPADFLCALSRTRRSGVRDPHDVPQERGALGARLDEASSAGRPARSRSAGPGIRRPSRCR